MKWNLFEISSLIGNAKVVELTFYVTLAYCNLDQ